MRVVKSIIVAFVVIILSFTALSAQVRGGIGGTLEFHGTPVPQGTPLEILVYAEGYPEPVVAIPLSPAFVGSSGNFTVWLNPLIYPDYVFNQIAVRWTQPYCHTAVVITSPKVNYSNQGITMLNYNYTGLVTCYACPIEKKAGNP